MLNLYGTVIDRNLSDTEMQKLLTVITEENRQRVLKFRRKEDKLRTLFGELLVRYVIAGISGMSMEKIIICRDEMHKPYLPEIPLCFNISHSGDYVFCAVSSQRVGVDIEEITEVDTETVSRFFTEEEQLFLKGQPENERKKAFFSLWTVKESYVKLLGKGMYIPFDSFSVSLKSGEITSESHAYFKQYEISGYECAVCSEENVFPKTINIISASQLKLI